MIKKKNLESINRLDKAGYVIYRNNRLVLTRQYNDSGRDNYIKDIGKCLHMFIWGVFSVIASPFCLFATLLDFIPKLYIIEKEN